MLSQLTVEVNKFFSPGIVQTMPWRFLYEIKCKVQLLKGSLRKRGSRKFGKAYDRKAHNRIMIVVHFVGRYKGRRMRRYRRRRKDISLIIRLTFMSNLPFASLLQNLRRFSFNGLFLAGYSYIVSHFPNLLSSTQHSWNDNLLSRPVQKQVSFNFCFQNWRNYSIIGIFPCIRVYTFSSFLFSSSRNFCFTKPFHYRSTTPSLRQSRQAKDSREEIPKIHIQSQKKNLEDSTNEKASVCALRKGVSQGQKEARNTEDPFPWPLVPFETSRKNLEIPIQASLETCPTFQAQG